MEKQRGQPPLQRLTPADRDLIGAPYPIGPDRGWRFDMRDNAERSDEGQAAPVLKANHERQAPQNGGRTDAIIHDLAAFNDSVSHDLRAPLRHVEEFSRLLLDDCSDQLDSRARGYVDRIQVGARRMGQLITDLLRLSRTTGVQMIPQAVNLSALCRTIVAELRSSEPDRQVDFVLAPGLVAEGDLGLLRVALENLLSNAWKYTGKHPSARIEFGTLACEGRVVYFVRDDGAGFDMAYAGKLFDAFQRLHNQTDFEGTGIGLTTVQRIIHRHGGSIWAEGAVECGATIYFTLGLFQANSEVR